MWSRPSGVVNTLHGPCAATKPHAACQLLATFGVPFSATFVSHGLAQTWRAAQHQRPGRRQAQHGQSPSTPEFLLIPTTCAGPQAQTMVTTQLCPSSPCASHTRPRGVIRPRCVTRPRGVIRCQLSTHQALTSARHVLGYLLQGLTIRACYKNKQCQRGDPARLISATLMSTPKQCVADNAGSTMCQAS